MKQEPLLGWDDLATAEVAPLCMAAPGALLYFLRIWKCSAFPPVVLLRRRESVVLTTQYLAWYEQRVGQSQVAVESRRGAILGPGCRSSYCLRSAEAWSDPLDVTGDTLFDYETRVDRLTSRGPLLQTRREGIRAEARANEALRAAGLFDSTGRTPDLKLRDAELVRVERKKTRRGRGKKGKNGEGTSAEGAE